MQCNQQPQRLTTSLESLSNHGFSTNFASKCKAISQVRMISHIFGKCLQLGKSRNEKLIDNCIYLSYLDVEYHFPNIKARLSSKLLLHAHSCRGIVCDVKSTIER